MKRISEVFDLPLKSTQETGDRYLQDANGDWALMVRLPWRADYAANAINHADALADALDNVIETLELYGAHDCPHYRIAIDALAAYRGAK